MTTDPVVQQKLRDSILEAAPELTDRSPTFEDVDPSNMPYLEAVIFETLRIARVASAFAREGEL